MQVSGETETERESVCVRVCGLPQTEIASVVKTAVTRTDHFGISQDKFRQIYF